MVAANGIMTNIRLIKTSPMLVQFTLKTSQKQLIVLSGTRKSASKIVMLEESKYVVAVAGHFKQRKQLVIEDMKIQNPDKFSKNKYIETSVAQRNIECFLSFSFSDKNCRNSS